MGTHPIFESDFRLSNRKKKLVEKMSESEEEYEVDKIVDDKIEDGEKMYLIRWKGFASDDDTWEPISNLECPDNIKEYERVKKEKKRDKAEKQIKDEPKTKLTPAVPTVSGFKRGLEAEKIIGATNEHAELMFLMKWKDEEKADLVPAKEANVKCPQVVIKFYEERLTWHNTGAS